jgi:hypothetical protein
MNPRMSTGFRSIALGRDVHPTSGPNAATTERIRPMIVGPGGWRIPAGRNDFVLNIDWVNWSTETVLLDLLAALQFIRASRGGGVIHLNECKWANNLRVVNRSIKLPNVTENQLLNRLGSLVTHYDQLMDNYENDDEADERALYRMQIAVNGMNSVLEDIESYDNNVNYETDLEGEGFYF